MKNALRAQGALLLEVVLALGLLVAAGSVIVGGLSSSATTTSELAIGAHAVDLAVTVSSRMAVGLLPMQTSDEQSFDVPFADFTWKAHVGGAASSAWETGTDDAAPTGAASARRVEITIRHRETGLVQRLAQWVSLTAELLPSADQETRDFRERGRRIEELFGDE